MRLIIKHSLAVIVTLVICGGCAVGPNYKRPAVDAPGAYRFASTEGAKSFADVPWWQVFKDPILQDLIGTTLTNNYDLKQAVARVEQARQQAVVQVYKALGGGWQAKPPAGEPPAPTLIMSRRLAKENLFQRHLDPASRLGEILFGLIMVLGMRA